MINRIGIIFPGTRQKNSEIRKVWMKIFHHDVKAGLFSTVDEAILSDIPGKYSKLSLLSDSMLIDGQFEFRLEYPQNGLVYHWTQAGNPMRINEGELDSDNFSQLLNPQSDGDWRGYLARSTLSNCTILDGCGTKQHWWYSIGTSSCSNGFFSDYGVKIPGPQNIGVNEVVLWVRIPDYYPKSEINICHFMISVAIIDV